jgi:hypothetical protein
MQPTSARTAATTGVIIDTATDHTIGRITGLTITHGPIITGRIRIIGLTPTTDRIPTLAQVRSVSASVWALGRTGDRQIGFAKYASAVGWISAA